MIAARVAELVGMAMIGDGALAVLAPDGHVRVWEEGPEWWEKLLRPFSGRPGLTRAVGAAELALGVALALAATRQVE